MLRTLTLALLLFTTLTARAQDIVHGDLGQALDRAIADATYGQFRGSILIARDGEILLAKGYGLARPGEPMTADSLLELASVSKAFTAAAILRLEVQGKLSTDDSISKHLAAVPDDKKDATIHNLLTHTSGIGYPTYGFPADEREAVVKVLLDAPMNSTPGTIHAYSNAGYWLLAAIVERASGRTFEEFVRDEVLRPAGMTSSACQTDPTLDLARCVDRVDGGRRRGSAGQCPYPFVWGYRGSGGGVVSARDMFAWDQALRGDALLPAAQRTKMFTPFLSNYACGWQISDSAAGRIASHTGGVAGFTVSFTRWLDRDACILVMTSPPHDPIALGKQLTETLFPETAERVKVTMRPGLVTLNEWGGGTVAGNDCTAEPEGGGVRIRFGAADSKAPFEIWLSLSAAHRAAVELAEYSSGILAGATSSAAPPVIGEFYTSRYRADDGTIVVEGDEVSLNIMPGTPHPEEGADRRVSIIIMDPANSFWPVIAKFDAARAKALSESILKAANR